MKWLTIDYIKQHSRIDFDCEDGLLELYGNAAEDALLNLCRRSMEDLMEKYGEVPAPLHVAALQLVENWYTNRVPDTALNLSSVPYAFDLLVKPYMRLSDD